MFKIETQRFLQTMKKVVILILFSLFLTHCSTTNYQSHKGLVFKQVDWEANLEQPFVINQAVEPHLGSEKIKLFLPADLFKNVTLVNVYYDGMESSDITYLNDEKNRILVRFDQQLHRVTSFAYQLALDQAVVKIDVKGMTKTVKIEDIRVPFYNKKNLTKN